MPSYLPYFDILLYIEVCNLPSYLAYNCLYHHWAGRSETENEGEQEKGRERETDRPTASLKAPKTAPARGLTTDTAFKQHSNGM